MTEPDPHLLPDGSTSWGPDRPPRHTPRFEAPLGRVEASSHPEPTEAMVEAYTNFDADTMDYPAWEVARIKAVIAAAPPEWLTDALLAKLATEQAPYVVALTEEQIDGLLKATEHTYAVAKTMADDFGKRDYIESPFGEAVALLDRALRGGEETCPACGGRGWHTAGGNDPATCGRCGGGEET